MIALNAAEFASDIMWKIGQYWTKHDENLLDFFYWTAVVFIVRNGERTRRGPDRQKAPVSWRSATDNSVYYRLWSHLFSVLSSKHPDELQCRYCFSCDLSSGGLRPSSVVHIF